jgi:outer membrane protein OmpA-like peptidoglycan-associated protein
VDKKLDAELKAADKIEHTLANGEKITIYRDGTEHLITDFLNSERYKNATAADLRDIWFEFDQIDFEFNSTDKLMPGSMDQLNNLIAILKAHPTAKMRIGGYADKVGTQVINYDISKARAEYIKSLFVEAGLHSQISTEGFGEEFATLPENATNAQRAIDRHIALRFEK